MVVVEIVDIVLRFVGLACGIIGLAALLRFYLNFYDREGYQNQEVREQLRKLKLEYEQRLRQLHERSKMLEALNEAIKRKKLIIKCSKHPNSPVLLLPDGTILCQEGQHRIWPENEESREVVE